MISRSRGSEAVAAAPLTRIAPGSLTVLCSKGYLSRASITTTAAPLSRRCFNSSLEIRGTGTTAYCDRAVRGVSTDLDRPYCAATRENGTTAAGFGSTVPWLHDAAGARGPTDHPTERFPQCMQRRKISPGSHETP